MNKYIKIALPTALVAAILFFLISGTIDKSSNFNKIQKLQKDIERTTTTVIFKNSSSDDATSDVADKNAQETTTTIAIDESSNEDATEDVADKNAQETTTTIAIDESSNEDAADDIPDQNTNQIKALGLGDIEDNFNTAYGKPENEVFGSTYKLVASELSVIFAPDKNDVNRALQINYFQKPTSLKKAQELVNILIPLDSVPLGTKDPGIGSFEQPYRSETLSSLFPPDFFLDVNAKPDLGFFRVFYDKDTSNLVYQISIVSGHFNR